MVAIAIKSCEDHLDRAHAQFKTWAIGSIFFWFTGPTLDVPDDYAHLPEKTHAICKKMRDWDHVFFCDTDTYVVVPRLMSSGFEQHDYAGYQLEARTFPYASGGAGYWLSKKSLNVLADADWSKVTDCDHNEDMYVGKILSLVGIPLHHDPRYALYESPRPDNTIISEHLSSREPYRTEFMYQAHQRMNL